MENNTPSLPTIFVEGLFQFLVWALLFIALIQGIWSLTAFSLLILITINGAKLWCRGSLSRLNCRVSADRRKVFPGEEITLHVQVENAKFLPAAFHLSLPVDRNLLLPGETTSLTREGGLLWYQKISWQWNLRPPKRGCYRLGPAAVAAGDLLGFYRRRKNAWKGLEIIVYPRITNVEHPFINTREFFGLTETRHAVEDPLQLAGTREYQHGRPARNIYWKASARHNRLQEKLLVSTTQLKVLLMVDTAPFAGCNDPDVFERLLEVVASLAAYLDEQRTPVGLAANALLTGEGASFLPAAQREQQIPDLLEILARMTPKSDRPLKELVTGRLAPTRGTSVILFVLEINEGARETAAALGEQKIPVTFVVAGGHSQSSPGANKIYNLDQLHPSKGGDRSA